MCQPSTAELTQHQQWRTSCQEEHRVRAQPSRLREILVESGGTPNDERSAALDRRLHLVDEATRRGFDDPEDRATAMVPDAQGFGVAPGA